MSFLFKTNVRIQKKNKRQATILIIFNKHLHDSNTWPKVTLVYKNWKRFCKVRWLKTGYQYYKLTIVHMTKFLNTQYMGCLWVLDQHIICFPLVFHMLSNLTMFLENIITPFCIIHKYIYSDITQFWAHNHLNIIWNRSLNTT